jgi:hypothetical protein
MSFLAPLFLLGAAALALPVVFHLIRRTSREKITFSSLMFLQQTPPRMTRKSRLEHIFLLLLRCLVLCLLALGFARPFLQRPLSADPAAGAGARVVVLVDVSASMRREGLWAEARARAERVLRGASPADAVMLVVFDRTSRTLVNFEQWASASPGDRAVLASQRLGEVTPGWGGTHLGHALLNAVELLEEQTTGPAPTPAARRIVLVTDLQAGAHVEGLQGFEWPRGIEVVLESVKARRPTNAGLQLVTSHDESEKFAGDEELRVRVTSAASSKREQFRLGWARPGSTEFAGATVDVYVPPGQSRVLTTPKAPTNSPTDRLLLVGDDEDFDNAAFVTTADPEQVNVLFLGREDEKDPAQLLYYIRRAFQETRRRALRVVVRPAFSPLLPRESEPVPLLVVSDPLVPVAASRLRSVVTNGATALFVMKSPALADTLAAVAGVEKVPAEEVSGDGYALLGQIDFQHPLFAPFADPRFSDFAKIHFWKHRRVDASVLPGARVLAKFDKGDPAIVQVPLGRGSVLLFTAGWAPADSQLALSTKFVPLLYSMLELSGATSSQTSQFIVGDTVPLGPTNAATPTLVRRPDGRQAPAASGNRFTDTELPGIYTVFSGSDTQRFAVNLDPAESRTDPMLIENLDRLGVPLKTPAPAVAAQAAARARLHAVDLEQRQKLWRWLLATALVVLVMETWIAGRLTQGSPAPAES